MAERGLPKPETRVRFPSPAPSFEDQQLNRILNIKTTILTKVTTNSLSFEVSNSVRLVLEISGRDKLIAPVAQMDRAAVS
jgi:hypothetical protein